MAKLHHLQVGCADCSVIIDPQGTLLVDTRNISEHSDLLPASKNIRGVFITHQHYDHFDGLSYLKDNGYKIDYLIFSPYERRNLDGSVDIEEWNDFNSFKDFFVKQGTQIKAPFRQSSFEEPWWKVGEISIWILGPSISVASSDTRVLHDASLVIKISCNKHHCLFTGDASDANLKYIADHTSHICDDILHASHHGSIKGADLDFIKKCNAKYTVISTDSSMYENVPHPTALQRYSDHTLKKVYRTDIDGSISWEF